jgi:hypothetical protein
MILVNKSTGFYADVINPIKRIISCAYTNSLTRASTFSPKPTRQNLPAVPKEIRLLMYRMRPYLIRGQRPRHKKTKLSIHDEVNDFLNR